MHNFLFFFITEYTSIRTKQFSLYLFSNWITTLSYGSGGGWINILYLHISYRNQKTEGLCFSLKNGYRKYIKIGDWIITAKINKP